MIKLKLQKVGAGLGVELPSEVLSQLQANNDENIFLENMFDGSYRLVKHDEELLQSITLIDGQMHEEDA
ncbi:hypothetical protein KO495_01465 [Colwellia sp. D2M02]|uniref:AbrB/MazE/SpoVT family DNA-binding domain-containing protein n=1 Tax=Colwellia sp. D2M02 TaxID=2841562 RepID=UPI001C0A56D0|nr:hypothetical protein [Colwellia sp. D2M02]MBU2891987.1 hypothetical protein [Colwellia sp. D2M02]